MPGEGSFTFREAMLSSLLLHAAVVILILVRPDLFVPAPRAAALDPNAPIPMQFHPGPEEPQDPDRLLMADAGSLEASDPRPPSAPPPENDDPFSVGNNPNRFLAPPVSRAASPEPGAGAEAWEQGEGPTAGEEPGAHEQASGGPAPEEGSEGQGPTAPPGDGGFSARAGRGLNAAGQGRGGAGSLRDALGRLSAGGSGVGDPLKFDNPVGGLSGPSGGLSFDTPGFNWGPYARRIYWIIWTNWTEGWPPAAHAGLAGVVTVRFRIHRDGTISDIEMIDPSGTPAFDTCATVALEASNPLPPLPADFPHESEGITARFFYNMRAR